MGEGEGRRGRSYLIQVEYRDIDSAINIPQLAAVE